MNNYLDSIVNELKDFPQSNSEILNLIQSRKNVYNHFKREFIKNINTIENEDLIAFALLIAAKNTDFELHQILSEHFDFNNINNPLAIFAKGIHGSKSGQNFAAFNLLYHSYKTQPLYFNFLDFALLLYLAKGLNLQTERKIILDDLIQKFPANIDLRLQQIDYFIDNNLFDDSKEFKQQINYLFNNITASAHWSNLAGICFNTGDIDNFFKCNEKAYTAEDFPSYNYVFIGNDKGKFPATDCLEFMNYLLDFLNANNIQAFPCSGSLLGLYRDGKLMDYDKDTDTGIIVNNNDEILNIIKILSANKILICSQINKLNFNKKILNISVSHKKNGSIVDIFFFHKNYYDYDKSHPKYNYLYTGIDTIVASRIVEFRPFKIIKKNLAGHIYNVPENIEEWLLQEYGKDWNKHISVWDSLIDAPNITEESKLAVFYFGSIRMHEAFRQKKYAKALNYYTQLKNRWNYPFTPQMCEIIETCLEKIKPQSKIE